jgi:flagellar hook assembly protein FlgD
LEQNYPNPFNPSTKIEYSIPSLSVILSSLSASGVEAKNLKDFLSQTSRNDYVNVVLKIYNILGREITTLVNKQQKPGNYQVEWNAEDLSSGIYFYQLKVNGWSDIKKMILLR